jgi:hypothetical protein
MLSEVCEGEVKRRGRALPGDGVCRLFEVIERVARCAGDVAIDGNEGTQGQELGLGAVVEVLRITQQEYILTINISHSSRSSSSISLQNVFKE